MLTITYDKSVPKHIKGLVNTWIRQANSKKLNNLSNILYADDISVSNTITINGSYMNEASNELNYSYYASIKLYVS